ncbi:MAG: hypothetical protein HY591_07090 [Candidatus Omnitrophica bacterium]|nr:hypothetical protein [Candidatus Omnitrophota bacterium]
MTCLVAGEDLKAKDAKIARIKSQSLKDPQALNFDFESLDAIGLGPDTLKKSLITLPVVSAKRLVVVRNVHKLKSADAGVLMQFLRAPLDHVDVVLESSQTSFKGELKDLTALCETFVLGRPSQDNAFDMTRLMTAGRAKESLNMLNTFYTQGTHPLQIMPALLWYWGKEGRSLSQEKFERGLKALEEADLNIKRSRLNPEYAVEKLIVELMELLRSA